MSLLFLIQLATCLFMTGLIWFVQIVHYPLFAEVGSAVLPRYEVLHAHRTGWVVFPPMLLELLSTIAALYPPFRPPLLTTRSAALLATLIAVVWLTTALGHVPIHNRLSRHQSDAAPLLSRLVTLNWLRTVAWTARSLILLAALNHAA